MFPSTYEDIHSLAGVGDYTAGAIASIAFGLPVPAVDGNVLRVTARITGDEGDITSPAMKKKVTAALAEIIPVDAPGAFNQAMMELGATVCLPNGAPQCQRCPAAFLCRAHREGTTGRIPVKAPKKPRRVEERRVYLLFHKNAVALRRRSTRGLLAGLWEYPNAPADEPDFLNELGLAPQGLTLAAVGKHIFTHIEWHLTALAGELSGEQLPPGWVWAELSQLREIYALPNAFQFAAPAVERRLAKTESEGGTAI